MIIINIWGRLSNNHLGKYTINKYSAKCGSVFSLGNELLGSILNMQNIETKRRNVKEDARRYIYLSDYYLLYAVDLS